MSNGPKPFLPGLKLGDATDFGYNETQVAGLALDAVLDFMKAIQTHSGTWLIVGAGLSFLAAALHIAIIFGGGDWYRFFGAGEGMARLAESGSREPAKMTLGIATVLTVWGLYALSGAGLIFRLPWRRLVLSAITAIYTVRGLAGLIAPWWIDHPGNSAEQYGVLVMELRDLFRVWRLPRRWPVAALVAPECNLWLVR